MNQEKTAGRRIALVGLPASGKTTVGKRLAQSMGLSFVDLDDVIEAEAGATCSAIFATEGEAAFRTRESQALGKVAAGGSVVLATGGGCVLSGANRALLRDGFTVVWLIAKPEVAALRSAGGSRPLLAGADPLERMKELHEARARLYETCADFSLVTDSMTIKDIVEAFHDSLR